MADYDIGALDSSNYSAPSTYSADYYSVDPYDTTDVFEFDLYSTSDINVALDPYNGDADISLYLDNGDGYFDPYYDTYVGGSSNYYAADDSINIADQGAGTYFAQVSYYDSADGYVSYNLDISATADYTPSNLLPVEYDAGYLYSDQTYYESVGNYDTSDTYYFSLDVYQGVDIYLDGLSSDADIRLVYDSDANGVVDSYDPVTYSNAGGTTSEYINQEASGNYFLQVYQYSGDTSYTLTFDQYAT